MFRFEKSACAAGTQCIRPHVPILCRIRHLSNSKAVHYDQNHSFAHLMTSCSFYAKRGIAPLLTRTYKRVPDIFRRPFIA